MHFDAHIDEPVHYTDVNGDFGIKRLEYISEYTILIYIQATDNLRGGATIFEI